MSFPQSYLIDILNNVRYAIPVERASFPDKWRRKDRPKEDQTSRTLGGQGGGLRDTPTNRGGYGRGDGGGNNWQNPYGQSGLGGGQRFPHHTKGRLAAVIGERDGQISATQRSRR
jgi:hypothetical protein